jgi:hypothetical protein
MPHLEHDCSTRWRTAILPYRGPCPYRLTTSWKMDCTCTTYSWCMWCTSTIPTTVYDLQHQITQAVNKVDLPSEQFGALSNSDSQHLVIAHQVSNCSPLAGMFIRPWNEKIKYLKSESVVSHLFHACSRYQTIDLGHLASITVDILGTSICLRLVQHQWKCRLKTDAVLCRCGVGFFQLSRPMLLSMWVARMSFATREVKCTTSFKFQKLYILPTLSLCVLYLSQNKQRLLPYIALTDWFL